MVTNRKPENNTQSGQSMVEFGVSLVILLLLLSGIIDVSRALFTYMALRDAAQEGALYGSINPTMTEAIEDRVYGSSNILQDIVEEETMSPGFSAYLEEDDDFGEEISADLPVSVDVTILGQPCAGSGIKVEISYSEFPITMPFLGTVIGSQSVGIKASAVDTIISPSCGG